LKNHERDMMRKIILSMVKKGHVHWSDLQKSVLASCHSFATSSTFERQLLYLLNKGFVEKISRGIYRMTEKGEKYLEIL
jgi:DNA-binding PadR family transcriptional regulator